MERTAPCHGMKTVNPVFVISNLEHAKVMLMDLKVNNAIKVIKRTLSGINFLIVKYNGDSMNILCVDTYTYMYLPMKHYRFH